MDMLKGYLPRALDFGIDVIVAIIYLLVGRMIIRCAVKLIDKIFTKSNMDISVKRFLESLIRAAAYIVLVIIVCDKVGIATTSFIAILSTAGVAIGLALQGSLSNFAGGVLILILRPFKVGDYIIDNGSGKEGVVERIDLFYTVLVTGDNKRITIPNGGLSNSAITNASAFDTRRVDFAIGVSYDSDINEAKATLEAIAKADESVLKDKEIFSFIQSLDSSQVTVGLRVWVNSADYWSTYFRMNEVIKNTFDSKNIEIPYNQLDVHMKNN